VSTSPAPAPPKKRTFYIEEKQKLGLAKRAIVIWDYKARNKDEITLKANQHVFVMQDFGYEVFTILALCLQNSKVIKNGTKLKTKSLEKSDIIQVRTCNSKR
jgi:hypothetical protein